MKKRHINTLMLVFSIIGGIIGYLIGEVLINAFMYRIPNVLIVGIYFAVFSLCVAIMCIIAEIISPRITGIMWHENLKTIFMIIAPIMVVCMFATGCVTQFIYGLDFHKNEPVVIDDYVFLMDNSGSMSSTDRDNLRISGVNDLVDNLDENCRISYYAFTHEAQRLMPLKSATPKAKAMLKSATSQTQSDGGTDIANVINMALDDVKDLTQPNRNMAIVLVSDGYDSFDTQPIIDVCNENNIVIHCIGLGNSLFGSNDILYELTDGTNGCFYDIQSASQLAGIYSNIQNGVTNSRLLLNPRHGLERKNVLLGIERVLFISLFGILMGLALGYMFDNRYLLKNFLIGGAVTGVLAGLLMETGFYIYLNTRFCRLGMDVLLALVMCMFTAVIPYEKNEGSINGTDTISDALTENSSTFGGVNSEVQYHQFD